MVAALLFFVGAPWATGVYELWQGVASWSTAVMFALPFFTVAAFAWLPVKLFGKSPALAGLHTYEFSEQSIHLAGPGFENRIDWSLVNSCRDFGDLLLFFSGKQAIINVPERALSPDERSRLKAWVGEKGIEMRG